MNTITFEKFRIKGANLGEMSCLPDIKNDDYIRAKLTVLPEVSPDESQHIGKGMIPTLLPYQIQSGYDREREILEFDAAILENEYLKATFVTELGGRLWSLYDKKEERELLVSGLFVAVGQEPDNGGFAELVSLDDKGYIRATESCRTDVDGIFTAGDCRTKEVRQLATAAADGAIAALAAAAYVS